MSILAYNRSMRDATFEALPTEFRRSTFIHRDPTNTWWFGLGNCDNPDQVGVFRIVDAYDSTDLVMRSVDVSIWSSGDAFDFWCRYDFVTLGDQIYTIFSDYYGVRIFNTRLIAVFNLPRSEEMKAAGGVYGFDFNVLGTDELVLKLWNVVSGGSYRTVPGDISVSTYCLRF
jgi:hypothetical protein